VDTSYSGHDWYGTTLHEYTS